MKIYNKPEMTVESLIAETSIAVDAMEFAELGERKKEEVSVPAADGWYDDLT